METGGRTEASNGILSEGVSIPLVLSLALKARLLAVLGTLLLLAAVGGLAADVVKETALLVALSGVLRGLHVGLVLEVNGGLRQVEVLLELLLLLGVGNSLEVLAGVMSFALATALLTDLIVISRASIASTASGVVLSTTAAMASVAVVTAVVTAVIATVVTADVAAVITAVIAAIVTSTAVVTVIVATTAAVAVVTAVITAIIDGAIVTSAAVIVVVVTALEASPTIVAGLLMLLLVLLLVPSMAVVATVITAGLFTTIIASGIEARVAAVVLAWGLALGGGAVGLLGVAARLSRHNRWIAGLLLEDS